MFAEALTSRLEGVICLTSAQIGVLARHYELLVRWNRVVNLTAICGAEAIVERHYCESLFLASRLPAGRLRIADIGAGAGFPGFPIAVARPDCTVDLIEAHRRKAVFLKEAARMVSNVRVLNCRAESVPESFDWAVSRAVELSALEPALPALAEHLAVLAGAEVPTTRPSPGQGFVWDAPIRVPWGDRRFLWIAAKDGTGAGLRCFT